MFCSNDPHPTGTCGHCRGKTTLAGPLWLGRIQEPDAIHNALAGPGLSRRAKKLLCTCASEVEVPMYYDHHSICERLNITPGKIDDVVQRLQLAGRQGFPHSF